MLFAQIDLVPKAEYRQSTGAVNVVWAFVLCLAMKSIRLKRSTNDIWMEDLNVFLCIVKEKEKTCVFQHLYFDQSIDYFLWGQYLHEDGSFSGSATMTEPGHRPKIVCLNPTCDTKRFQISSLILLISTSSAN